MRFLTFAAPLLALSLMTLVSPVNAACDCDRDGVPDNLEPIICGSPAVRTVLTPPLPIYCASPSELITPFFLPDLDADNDNVPDDLEPFLCFVENQNTNLDGTCTGSDYHPPP